MAECNAGLSVLKPTIIVLSGAHSLLDAVGMETDRQAGSKLI
jgi:hypothetical protein